MTSNHFRLQEPSITERASLYKSLIRYGLAPLAPENETGEDTSPVIIQVHPDLWLERTLLDKQIKKKPLTLDYLEFRQ